MGKAQKTEYSECEIATLLGISVENLRQIVRERIVGEGGGVTHDLPTYQASDLIVLRFLASSYKLTA